MAWHAERILWGFACTVARHANHGRATAMTVCPLRLHPLLCAIVTSFRSVGGLRPQRKDELNSLDVSVFLCGPGVLLGPAAG